MVKTVLNSIVRIYETLKQYIRNRAKNYLITTFKVCLFVFHIKKLLIIIEFIGETEFDGRRTKPSTK